MYCISTSICIVYVYVYVCISIYCIVGNRSWLFVLFPSPKIILYC